MRWDDGILVIISKLQIRIKLNLYKVTAIYVLKVNQWTTFCRKMERKLIKKQHITVAYVTCPLSCHMEKKERWDMWNEHVHAAIQSAGVVTIYRCSFYCFKIAFELWISPYSGIFVWVIPISTYNTKKDNIRGSVWGWFNNIPQSCWLLLSGVQLNLLSPSTSRIWKEVNRNFHTGFRCWLGITLLSHTCSVLCHGWRG